jgi:hypothetical protein
LLNVESLPSAPETTETHGTLTQGTPPAPQGPAATPVASVTPAAVEGQPTEVIDWKARHDKLTTESIPTLQRDRDTLRNRVTELEGKLGEQPDPDELAYEVGHERDMAMLGWLEDIQKNGATLKQAVDHLNGKLREASNERELFETKRQSTDSLIKFAEGYDPKFATFLRAMDKNGTRVASETIPSLRELYNSFAAQGATPAQAAAAATPNGATPPATGQEPPVVAPAGAPQKMTPAPVWRPGMRASDMLHGEAMRGFFTDDGARKPRA